MNDEARNHGSTLARVLAFTAILLGVAAIIIDVVQGDEFRAASVVPIVVGVVVLALVRKRGDV